MRHLDLFSGIGGFALAAQWVWGEEHEIVSFCEIDKFCQRVLKKHWPDVPICEDIRSFDAEKFKGTVDIITGGFPCQDLSIAGKKRGFSGKRSSLYSEMLRIVSKIRPRYVIFENVANLLKGDRGRWFGKFLYDLAQVRYDAQWHSVPASSINAPHNRDRIWVISYPTENVCFEQGTSKAWRITRQLRREIIRNRESREWDAEPEILRMADGIPNQLDRLGSLGNAIVPQVAQVIFQAIKEIEK